MNSKPKIGFVSYWFNRGQATVTRYIKSIFDEAGYDTFVLVRKANSPGTNVGDWAQNNITIGSKNLDIDLSKYISWVKENNIKVVFFDQNYQFEEIYELKKMGVKTIGRFVWEDFGKEHTAGAKKAFDIIYSLTRAEHSRYLGDLNINSRFIRWGIHPSLFFSPEKKHSELIWFYYPAGYCSSRKSVNETIRAFKMTKNKNIRLLITTQKLITNIDDNRITIMHGDIEKHKDFLKIMAKCDVCLIPSRWEGLGLAFVEALSLNMPILTTNYPPMNEYIINNSHGYLINCTTMSKRPNGLLAADIDVRDFSSKISKIANKETINQMSYNIDNFKKNMYNWNNTKEDYLNLLKIV